ncbi:MAG: LysR family transcriptional regulator [Oceanospirillaceae bacterium]|nr:LysR family transcriptional regulator [Oceanospirillaceae bacterium]
MNSHFTVKQLRAFVAVAKTRSFTEACEQVHLSQPALSIAIKNLEDSLGGKLLMRTTRALRLTPEGEVFFKTAMRLLTDWDDAFEEVQSRFSLYRGKISISCMPSFAGNQLPAILLKFRRKHPDINVAIQDVIAEEVVELVRTGRVEIGISFDPGDAEDLLFEPLFEDNFIAAFAPDHVLADKTEITWEEAIQNELIALQRPSSMRMQIERELEKLDLNLNVSYEAHQLATVGRMAATGMGIGLVPTLCERQMKELGAICIPIINPIISRKVGIITRKRSALSAAAQGIVNELKDSVQES